jgi:alkylation response protein AidB-like acyl-CoA dehydrogenase
MDFELPEELRLVKQEAYKFAVKEFGPIARECDRMEKYPKQVWKRACEYSLIGAWIPEGYGGTGAGFLTHALITEQFAQVDLGISLIGAAVFGAENIYLDGSEEQKRTYLPRLVSGEIIFAGA